MQFTFDDCIRSGNGEWGRRMFRACHTIQKPIDLLYLIDVEDYLFFRIYVVPLLGCVHTRTIIMIGGSGLLHRLLTLLLVIDMSS